MPGIVFGRAPLDETLVILRSLAKDKKNGLFEDADGEALLSRESYANSDIDILLSISYKIPVLVFRECSNGGGFALTFRFGLEHFATRKYMLRHIILIN